MVENTLKLFAAPGGGSVITTPELLYCTTSTVQAVEVDGPQFVVLTVPKLKSTFSDGGVRVGGVAEDKPNWFEEYASGQFV
jgi:hypothetical protein